MQVILSECKTLVKCKGSPPSTNLLKHFQEDNTEEMKQKGETTMCTWEQTRMRTSGTVGLLYHQNLRYYKPLLMFVLSSYKLLSQQCGQKYVTEIRTGHSPYVSEWAK